MLLAIHEFSIIDLSILICLNPLPMRPIVLPFTFVETSVDPSKLPITVSHVSLQIAAVSPKFRDENRCDS